MDSIKTIRDLVAAGKLPDKPITSVMNMNETAPQQWIIPKSSYPPHKCEFSDDYKLLIDHLDIVCFNCYGGYFDQNGLTQELGSAKALEASLSWVPGKSIIVNQISAIRSAMMKIKSDKPFWLTETGWSSSMLLRDGKPVIDIDGNLQTDSKWSNIENMKNFYNGFIKFDTTQNMLFEIDGTSYNIKPPEKIFYFSLRDSHLSRLEIDEFFGLFEIDVASLKSKI